LVARVTLRLTRASNVVVLRSMIHPSQTVRRDAVRYLTPQAHYVQENVEGSADNAMLAPQRNGEKQLLLIYS